MDQLYQFACAYLDENPVYANMPAEGPRSKIAEFEGVLLKRAGNFQVQLFIMPPNYVVPAHVHPNVDSIEVYVDGAMRFSHGGSYVFDTIDRQPLDDSGSYKWRMLRVRPEDRHGAVIGPLGARFISIQHWLNGVTPDCVALDYTGPVVDEDHLRQVKTGEPEPRRQSDLRAPDAL